MNKVSQTVPYQFDTIFSPFKTQEFEYALKWLSENGFTGVELAIAYPKDVNITSLLMALNAAKLTATTLSTGQVYGLDGLFLSSFDKDIRNKAIDIVKGHIDLSCEIGLPPVTIGLLRGKLESGDKKALLQNFKSALLPCIDYADKKGVLLQIEPINRSETVLLNSTYETLEFIAELENPKNVGILYDTYHSNIEDNGMLKAIEAAGDKLFNIHFADSNRHLPGFGDIDFMAIYSAIQATGYNGAYALETLMEPSREFVLENSSKSILNIVK